MEAQGSRRDFIRRAPYGVAFTGLLSGLGERTVSAQSRQVDRRRLGRVEADVSILGLGLGAFMDAYSGNREAGYAILESALARGINYCE